MSHELSPSPTDEPIIPLETNIEEEADRPDGDPLSIADFEVRFNESPTAEDKLRCAIDFMKRTLAAPITPYFKGFWQARENATPLFKESIPAASRAEYWKEYRELCSEFQRLKEMLDEQAAFAAEQIEIAIKAIENDLSQLNDTLERQPELQLPGTSKTIERNFDLYDTLQKELNLLNTHAARINALRKELIKTEMRIRVKNKFFKELSTLGDKVFPRRKELIKALSEQFLTDIDAFVSYYFQNDQVNGPLFFLREEIKALQTIAKVLTLNTFAFTQTRSKLSVCWDLLKSVEKEKKKERLEKRGIFKQNEDLGREKIALFKDEVEKGEITAANLESKSKEIYQFLSSLELGRDERRALSDALREASKPILDQIKQEEDEKRHKEEAAAKAKIEEVKDFKASVNALLEEASALDISTINERREQLLEKLPSIPCLKLEKQQFEKMLKSLNEIISEKKEQALLALPADELSALEELRDLLKQRKESRKECKTHLENLRKSKSQSLSIEKALQSNELLEEEKERLEKIDASIQEIEDKIRALSSSRK